MIARVLCALLALGLFKPSVALAEKGALTFEGGASVRVTALPPPHALEERKELMVTAMPHLGLAVRYAITHDLGLGLRFGGEPWRSVAHEDTSLPGFGGAEPLVGRLVHSYASFSLEALTRVYLRGFDFRLYLEPFFGWTRRLYKDLDHLRLLPDSRTISYGLRLPDFAADDLSLGAGLGLEHVWDRATIGVRATGAVLLLNDRAARGSFVVYAGYDLYP